jgi:hypothetical protein
MRLFHLKKLYFGLLLAWEATTPRFEALTTHFEGNVEIKKKFPFLLCGMSPSHESFMYMWHHLNMFLLGLLLCVNDKLLRKRYELILLKHFQTLLG